MDEDFALALQLSEEYEREGDNESRVKELEKPMSIVDPQWELIDPVPDIRELFVEFDAAYFDGMLGGVEVVWSSRMTLCAGLCCYQGRGGLCTIKLSTPLLKLRPRKDLVETLLHEMIHALLFVTDNNKDHDGHGPEFHKHMYRINEKTGTNISVYHSFHQEVNNYRQHWWRCDGPCVKRPPFYGIVRRAMNRAPSPRDTWWAMHQQKCGGKFTKIKEPDGYGEKKSKVKSEQKTKTDPEKVNSKSDNVNKSIKPITDWFAKTNNTNSNSKNDNELLKKDSLWSNKTKVNITGMNFNNSNEQIFSASSKNSSSNIYGFKMSAVKNETSNKKRFSGTGHTLASSSTITSQNGNHSSTSTNNADIKKKRENFLKRLESSQDKISNKRIKLSIKDQTCQITYSDNFKVNDKDKSNSNIQSVIIIDENINSDLVECPACPAKMPGYELNTHLDKCLS